MLDTVKSRFNTLNVIRLVVGGILIGEGIHSSSWWMLGVTVILFYQIFLNKQCIDNC
jgi:hypothetical protein